MYHVVQGWKKACNFNSDEHKATIVATLGNRESLWNIYENISGKSESLFEYFFTNERIIQQ